MAEGAREQDEPAAPEAAGARTRPDTGKLRVFVSYSRDDLDFADQLDIALELHGYDVTIDREGISGGEDFQARLGNLIREAETVVFVLSPASAASDMCAWEVEEAVRLGKRILPVVCRPLEGVPPPPRLKNLDYIFFYPEPRSPGTGFGSGMKRLVQALNTDLDWLREHTRLLARATEWERANRVANRMLSGGDISEAKAWAARRPKGAPELTELHLDYIRASEAAEDARLNAERQRLAEMAAAQDARAKALAGAEAAQRERAAALEQAAVAHRARARAQRIIAWGSAAAALVLAVVAALAGLQWRRAEERKLQAENILGSATNFIWRMVDSKKIDTEDFDHMAGVFERGAEFGDTNAMRGLGWVYFTGQGTAQDYAKAREWYEKAVSKGDAGAMTNLGTLYVDGLGVPQDYTKAREWYEKAAAKGDAGGMSGLGWLYFTGSGVAQDYAKAREFYEKGAAKYDAVAMAGLGALYTNGLGVPQDYAKGREWYEKAAAKDDAGAMAQLGWLHASGYGAPQDYAKGREWYEKAAAKDDAGAMAGLGMLYFNGYGVSQDYAKAREWYEKAAAKGNVAAMYNLGALYYDGQGVAQDYAKAHEWYEKAAAKGYADAQRSLCVIYSKGLGVAQDYAKAGELCERAASKDDVHAMHILGLLYYDGLGVAKDNAKAREWFEKAAAKGFETAQTALDQLAIEQAEAEGRFEDALRSLEAVAAKIEDAETKRDGRPGKETGKALHGLAWQALLAREYAKALAAGDRALPLAPDIALSIDTNRAHALLFLDRLDEARALYLAHRGEKFPEDDQLWEAVIGDDYAKLRKAGLDHPLMAEIEAAFKSPASSR